MLNVDRITRDMQDRKVIQDSYNCGKIVPTGGQAEKSRQWRRKACEKEEIEREEFIGYRID